MTQLFILEVLVDLVCVFLIFTAIMLAAIELIQWIYRTTQKRYQIRQYHFHAKMTNGDITILIRGGECLHPYCEDEICLLDDRKTNCLVVAKDHKEAVKKVRNICATT